MSGKLIPASSTLVLRASACAAAGGLLLWLALGSADLSEYRLRTMPDTRLRVLAQSRPNHGLVQRAWADRTLARGDLQAAENLYRAAVTADPTDRKAWTAWGTTALAMGQTHKSIEILKQAVEEWPGSAETQFALAAAFTQVGDVASAIRCWRAGLRSRRESWEAWISLGSALEETGSHAEALSAFQTAARAVPGSPAANVGAARCLIALGRGKEARPALEAVLRQDPGNLAARMALAEAHLSEGTPESRAAALKELARAGVLHPEAPGPPRRMAEIWMTGEELPDAAQAFARAAIREPSNETHHEMAAEAYRRLGLPQQAESFRRRAEEARGWKRDAERWRKEAVASPDSPKPLREYARLCERLMWYPEAADAYTRLLRLLPDDRSVARKLAEVQRRVRRYAEERFELFTTPHRPVPLPD